MDCEIASGKLFLMNYGVALKQYSINKNNTNYSYIFINELGNHGVYIY